MLNYGGKTYAGMPYGVLSPGILQTRISFLPSAVIYDGTNCWWYDISLTHKYVSLTQKHTLRGWSGLAGDAQTWYELGIAASHAQWGVASSDAAAYLASVAPVSMETMATEKVGCFIHARIRIMVRVEKIGLSSFNSCN